MAHTKLFAIIAATALALTAGASTVTAYDLDRASQPSVLCFDQRSMQCRSCSSCSRVRCTGCDVPTAPKASRTGGIESS